VKVEDETNAALLLMCCDNIIDACVKLLKLKQPKPLAFFGQEQKAPIAKEVPVVKKSTCLLLVKLYFCKTYKHYLLFVSI